MSQANQNTTIIQQPKVGELVLTGSALPVEVMQEFPPALQNGYEWFNKKNERVFRDLVEGLVIAWQHDLNKQIALYKAQIVDILSKDGADRVAALSSKELQYGKLWYQHPDPALKQPIQMRDQNSTWVFHRLVVFSHLVPPSALRALAFLDTHEIVPDELWVAEKKERRRTPRSRPDPILCASFGRYFVALAEWK